MRKVPIESLIVASVFFYEHGTPTNWTVFHQNQEKYEVYTMNRHNQRHHTLACVGIESEEFYKTGWRSADILPKIKSWHRRHSSNSEFSIVFKKLGDTDRLNSRFAYHDRAPPFILLGVPPSEDPVSSLQRNKRDASSDPTTRVCNTAAPASEPCCLATKLVNLDDHSATTDSWWVSPRNFDMTYCTGVCRSKCCTITFPCKPF